MMVLKRLGWYLVGLSIGLIFLVFFLKKKSEETGVEFCYLPNCRVLKDIRSKPLSFTEEANTALQTHTLDSVALAVFLREGTVDFKNSNTQSAGCKTYRIKHEWKAHEFQMTIENCDSKATVQSIQKLESL